MAMLVITRWYHWCEHCFNGNVAIPKASLSPVIIEPGGLGFPSKIHTNQERRKTCVNTSFWGYSNAFASKVNFFCVFEVLAFDLYQIYIYTYLPCMSACFGLVCISHQFFTWSQDLFIWYHMCYLQTYVQKNWRLHSGSRSVFGSASTETYARDGSSLGLPHQNWVWNWVKPWKRSDNRQKKTIAPKYLLRLVFWFERYLSVFDLSIRSHLHLQGEVRSFAPILPSQQQLTGRSKQLDSMV